MISKLKWVLLTLVFSTTALLMLRICWDGGNVKLIPSSPITIVTGYFPLEKAKHSHAEYDQWMSNFLPKVDTPMVIYTQPPLLGFIQGLRQGKPTSYVLFENVWDVANQWWWDNDGNNHSSKGNPRETYYYQHQNLDPQKSRRSPELYAVWNSKLWMVNEVVKKNPFGSTYFFWMDMGCVRKESGVIKQFPNLEKVEGVFGKDEKSPNFGKINMFTVSKFNTTSTNQSLGGHFRFKDFKVVFAVGGFFGGTSHSIPWFTRVFYKLHQELLKEHEFVGNDQTLFTNLIFKDPSRFLLVCTCDEPSMNVKGCIRFFYFLRWYANTSPKNITGSCNARGDVKVTNLRDLLES